MYDSQRPVYAQTTELVPGGSRIRVDNHNKLQYLDALAQFRLATCVRDEVEHFLKGLNELIPDNLLCIFDENELEVSNKIRVDCISCTYWECIVKFQLESNSNRIMSNNGKKVESNLYRIVSNNGQTFESNIE